MKRTLSVLLCLTMVLTLCACNGTSDPTGSTTTPSTGPLTPTGPLYDRASYTVSDDAAIAARDQIVLQVGSAQMRNGFFQFSYWSDYFTFLDTYGSYASMLGLDITLPLDQQTQSDSAQTWQQFFISKALSTLHQNYAMMLEAEASGLELPAELLQELDQLDAALETAAKENGFDTALAYIQSRHGPGSTVEDFRQYMKMTYIASYYYSVAFDAIPVTDQIVQDFYEQNKTQLNQSGITKDGTYIHNLQHILFAVKDDGTDADREKAAQDAQALLDQWLAGEHTKESFAALVQKHANGENASVIGENLTGLTADSDFDQAFKDWYLSTDRQSGDYAIIKTDFGYHVTYYVETQETWYYRCAQAVINTQADLIPEKAMAKHPLTVDYSKIMLGIAPLSIIEN